MRGLEQIPWLYDGLMAGAELLGLRRWRRRLVEGARGRVLEVGCGTGRDLPLYADPGRVIGMDPDLAALRRARHRAPSVPLVVARAEALPFADGAFDTVVSGLVFCSVQDPPRALGEVRRVLAEAGELRMLEHVRHTRPLLARAQDRVQPAWTCITGGCHPNRDTEAAVEQAGFCIESEDRVARGVMRRFAARVCRAPPDASGRNAGDAG
ncbi:MULTISPECIES: class I SAM-dependent methyltransferase [unclassified Thioalkalivibrio]|uniref:class I SAM-dependent methyltransferase n=1 Tax=unclassified Thioalkalivibrio TaxID=2621013 RepID=UPI0003823CD5|nr:MULTISPECIES: class I SAM-dependent methyltransferase [unclassified Thioalkalivibrio]